MLILLWLKGLLSRRPGRLLGAIAGVALTVALLAAIGVFIVASGATMTQRAIASVPVDWQIQLAPGTDAKAVTDALGQSAAYSALQTVCYADSDGFTAKTKGTVQTTGAGKVLGIGPNYRKDFAPELRPLIGSLDGVLVAQQTAANLQVAPGDTITIQRPGLPAAEVKVDGVIDLPFADSLFQAIGTPAGMAPQAPPDNVLILPLQQWHSLFDPQAQGHPDSVHLQLHVRLIHNLPPTPIKAYTQVEQQARNLEARIAGSGIVGDNLGAKLDGTRKDSLYSQVLFLFLGLPGVILSVLLTLAVTAAGSDRRRQEQSLLRTRGATIGQILQLAGVESAVVGTGGAVLGLGLAVIAMGLLTPGTLLLTVNSVVWMAIAAVVGVGLAVAAILYPAWKTARSSTVVSAKAIIGNSRKPLWRQIWLDGFLLTLAFVVFWRTASTGYQVVLAPEGVPQASVSYDSFIAPVCLWLGTALLTLRLGDVALGRGRSTLTQLLRVPLGSLAGVVIASLSRQRRVVTSSIALVAIAVSFAVSTAVFNTTYNAQARVDAELTNGADVQVVVPPNSTGIPLTMQTQLKGLANVAALQPMQHRFAYVGRDLQDIYGIDPVNLPTVTHIADAYFANHDAQSSLAALASRADGILVSAETVRDFQLKSGDLLNLRLQNAQDGQYHIVPFHFVGVVKEFPTAPTDSFLLANADYIAKQTGNSATETVLIRTKNRDRASLLAQIKPIVSPLAGVKVTDIDAAQRTISSGLTAVDLRGLTRIELSFAILLLVGATGLMLALGMAERRRTFAILDALGAKPRQLGSFLWTEGLLVLLAGGTVGVLLGFGVAAMLVKVLTGVFDPPPDVLAIPWLYLLMAAIASVLSTVIAILGTQSLSSKASLEALRDT
ncbi:ABC transporter permease [Nodosilinea nodulosa]|uniref:ABC transporter permease n=1 Tax=Nodosilinea nodulosa TaxID=416001 RepID=UPI0002F3AD52|nr:ABC transporter permease [Nodosilinea nodulosa]